MICGFSICLVTILEHQDEAEGNKDMMKALILKVKQMKMRYCAIPCAKTISKSDQTSTFSTFRARKSFEKNGATFAGELTRSFSLRRAYLCSQHFDTKDIVKTLCGIRKAVNGALPTIFNPQEFPCGTSEREKRMISRRRKRNSRDESDLKFPAKSTRVSSDVALKDRDYFFRVRKTKSALRQLIKKT